MSGALGWAIPVVILVGLAVWAVVSQRRVNGRRARAGRAAERGEKR